MKIYLAGPITGIPNYKEIFAKEEVSINALGHTVMNPAILPEGFTQDEYMVVCYAMMDVCEGVYFLKGWEKSKGAQLEWLYAKETGRVMIEEIGYKGQLIEYGLTAEEQKELDAERYEHEIRDTDQNYL